MRRSLPHNAKWALRLVAQEASFHMRRKDGLTTAAFAGIIGIPRTYVSAAEELRSYVPMKALRAIIAVAGMEDKVEWQRAHLDEMDRNPGDGGI